MNVPRGVCVHVSSSRGEAELPSLRAEHPNLILFWVILSNVVLWCGRGITH